MQTLKDVEANSVVWHRHWALGPLTGLRQRPCWNAKYQLGAADDIFFLSKTLGLATAVGTCCSALNYMRRHTPPAAPPGIAHCGIALGMSFRCSSLLHGIIIERAFQRSPRLLPSQWLQCPLPLLGGGGAYGTWKS